MLVIQQHQKHASISKISRLLTAGSYFQLQETITMKKVLVIAILFAFSQASAQQKSVLFLGNSYTYSSNLPGTLYNLAAAGGDTIYHEQNTPGGYTLEGHSTNATSLSKIASRNWDFVVMQEQSQKPSFPPAQVAAETYPYAEILVDSIKSNYACTEPLLFMTWGRRDGDQSNCQFYTPLCTFEGMNARLRQSYLEMGEDNDATVAPCGAAWHQMSLENNSFWSGLYSGDGSHPSPWGTYLNACVFYATIFRTTPVGLPYYANIGQEDAETLQQLAEDIVIDSLDNWFIGHQDVVAELTVSQQLGTTVSFENASINSSEHFWDFGNGNTSNEPNPTHNFMGDGLYDITFVASSNCDEDTAYYELNLNTSGVEDDVAFSDIEFQVLDNQLMINSTDSETHIQLFDMTGRVLFSDVILTGTSYIDLPNETRLLLLQMRRGNSSTTKKLFVN
jgi:hypothetical protein